MIKGQKNSQDQGFDYKRFETEALAGLQSGKGLIGEDGILRELMRHLVQSSLEGELKHHLKESKSKGGPNRRNGHTSKTVQTHVGPIQIHPPRDREGDFEPRLVGKWDRKLNSGFDAQIIELYSLGNSLEDIQFHLKRMYGAELSTSQLSTITEQVRGDIEKWQKRPLQSFYILLYLDAIHFKVRENGRVITKAIYTVYGVQADGFRDVLCLYAGQGAEGAKGWGRVLEHIKDRGVEDVLFFCVDGLGGFKEAILEVYPQSVVQRCIVHMVRNSLKFVDDADAKPLIKDLKKVYQADTEPQGLEALSGFEQNWNGKYPDIAKAWRKNWTELTAFFGFNWAVRRIMYTTNAVEGLHRMLRKTTKAKGAFVSENALMKLLYLTLQRKEEVWKRRVHAYKAIQRNLAQEFGDRFEKHVNN
jgi:transposase-like protein